MWLTLKADFCGFCVYFEVFKFLAFGGVFLYQFNGFVLFFERFFRPFCTVSDCFYRIVKLAILFHKAFVWECAVGVRLYMKNHLIAYQVGGHQEANFAFATDAYLEVGSVKSKLAFSST